MLKLLLILKLPPPVHGSTVMNKVVDNSMLLKKNFDVSSLGLSISKDTDDIGKWSFRKVTHIFRDYFKLIQEIYRKKPDLVYFALSPISTAFIKDSVFILILKIFRIPIVYHLHVKGIKTEYNKKFWKWLYKSVFRNEYVIILADTLLTDIEFLPIKKIFVIPNGIEETIKDSDLITVDEEVPVITFLSNFIKSKGIVEFLLACGELKQKGYHFKIAVIGKEIDISLTEVKLIIESQKLEDNISFLGSAYGKQKFDILLNSQIFVFPSYYDKECLPLVLLEAMQCGLPVVTSREGAIPEIIKDGINGLLIDPRNPSDITNAIIQLLNSKELMGTMSRTNRLDFKKNYTVQEFEHRLSATLSQIAEIQLSGNKMTENMVESVSKDRVFD